MDSEEGTEPALPWTGPGLFKIGEKVSQFWANWMDTAKDEQDAPTKVSYKNKTRTTWYVSTITGMQYCPEVRYAGIVYANVWSFTLF